MPIDTSSTDNNRHRWHLQTTNIAEVKQFFVGNKYALAELDRALLLIQQNSLAISPLENVVLRFKREQQSLSNIRQFYIQCDNDEQKYDAIFKTIYSLITMGQTMIFCRDEATAHELALRMRHDDKHCIELLSSKLTVKQRLNVIKRFRKRKIRVLVDTNICARGVDIEGISLVLNFEFPLVYDNAERRFIGTPDFDTYSYRIGRINQFSHVGYIFNLVTALEIGYLTEFHKYFDKKIEEFSEAKADSSSTSSDPRASSSSTSVSSSSSTLVSSSLSTSVSSSTSSSPPLALNTEPVRSSFDQQQPPVAISLTNIRQFFIKCLTHEQKYEATKRIFRNLTIGQAIIFCRTKSTARELGIRMANYRHSLATLTTELNKEQRASVINQFHHQQWRVLISTNVVAQEIDIDGVSFVINYDIPVDRKFEVDCESYSRRIACCSQLDKLGYAFNLIGSKKDYQSMKLVEEYFNHPIKEISINELNELKKMFF